MVKQATLKLGNRIIYAVIALALLGLIGYTIWGAVSGSTSAQTILQVEQLDISRSTLAADGLDYSQVRMTLTTKDDGLPAANVWVGLDVVDDKLASPDLTHFGWYSPEPNRSFYQTNTNGEVTFEIKSTVTGAITYGVYAANPGERSAGKYEPLGTEFTLTFQ